MLAFRARWIVVGLALGLLSCKGASATATPLDTDATQPVVVLSRPPPGPMPAACLRLLVEVECWLGAAGNDARDVTVAVGNLRARVDALQASDAGEPVGPWCAHVAALQRSKLAGAGCGDVEAGVDALPPPVEVACARNEHFFIRETGRVAGCHKDCTTADDCPSGHACSGKGSAPGGPVDEPFCD